MSGKWISSFWIPMYRNAGLNDTLKALSVQGLSNGELVGAINAKVDLPSLNWEMLTEYISDVQNIGELSGCQMIGIELPPPTERNAAPTGLGQDANGIWFGAPNSGEATVCWFRNSELRFCRLQDTSTDRSATKAELGVVIGDKVQICILDNQTYGWWANIEVT
ncbi:hypothetical protein GF380_00380 [Candidatus Uhrbacteria bacterium]|nr:hypothetical protein [Candidatus Uhrbacteria bacterium]